MSIKFLNETIFKNEEYKKCYYELYKQIYKIDPYYARFVFNAYMGNTGKTAADIILYN